MPEILLPPNLVAEKKPTLLNAFEVFQRQCELLENSHTELQSRLENAQVSLEQKNRELASRIAEIEGMKERLSGIIESINDAVILINLNDEIEMANHAATQLFGDVKKLKISDFSSEMSTLLCSGKSVKDKDIHRVIDGEKQIFMLSILPMPLNKYSQSLRVISLKDVTEHRRLQQQVAREDRMAALGQVSANVAHEIRNPLFGIEGFARLLERELDEDPAKKQLAKKITYATRQLNAVVTNLLNFNREVKNNLLLHEFAPLLEEIIHVLLPMAEDKQTKILFRRPKINFQVEIDAIQIKQVITNLITNAIEACCNTKRGKVVVKLTSSKSNLQLTIQDNGIGIQPSVLRRIFEPFFTTKDGGVGLGLSLCQRIIESHGGSIFCSSEFGKGTKFTINLKLKKN